MTNMADCIARAIDFGEIDRARGVEAIEKYQQLVDRYSTIMGPDQAAIAAARDLKAATKAAKTRRMHTVINQLQAMRRIRDLVEGSPDPAIAVRNLLEYSEGSGFKGESVASLVQAYETRIAAEMQEVLGKVGLNVTGGSRDAALLEKFIVEAHGTDTGDAAAKSMADALRKVQQSLRRGFNAHGGDIGDLSDYGIPHSHDADLMRKMGVEAWIDAIHDKLAWHRIPDHSTGQPFAETAGQVPPRPNTKEFLEQSFENITSAGWSKKDPSMTMGGKALYNQRAEHRVLHFGDGQAWIEYNRAFGSSDPFSAMMNGLHGVARDVAMMRVLGPNPRMGLEFASQVAIKRARDIGDTKLIKKVDEETSLAKTMLAYIDGSANVPQSIAMARFFSGTRAVLTSAQLGSAVLSSFSDVATISKAARHIGMNRRNVLSRSVELMASQATRATAARMGYIAPTLADAGSGAARYFGKMMGNGIPERLAGLTTRATGLNFITDMRKIAFQMEFAGFLADHADAGFAALPAPLRKVLSDRGINSNDWDLLRSPKGRFVAPNGADFISPIYWLEHQTALPRVEAEGLAMRLQAVIQEQLEYAVPTTSIEGRARWRTDTKSGTVGGEFLNSAFMYKNFTMSLMLRQYRRFMDIPDEKIAGVVVPWGKIKYAVHLSTLLVLTGALTIQLKELAKGNDPRPMNSWEFWTAALLQGGGLGIFGDFFASEQSRAGGSLGETAAGPVFGLIGDLVKPVAANLTSLAKGEDTRLGRDVVGLAQRNTPFLSSAWYARTAYSRIVMDNLSIFLDPDAEAQMRRRIKKQEKDYGTRPYWAPGDNLPRRAPDLSNALGSP